MILCVSIGNTNIRCAVGSIESYIQAVKVVDKICYAKEFIHFVETNYGADIWKKLHGCVISSVVPQKNKIITEAISEKNSKLPIRYTDFRKSEIDFSLYKSQLGEDRAVCCTAAVAKHGTPVIVIDLGTATTINVVNRDKIFLGGAILTGIQTGLTSLINLTAQLPLVDNFMDAKLIGCDTQECLVSGAVIGMVCMIEGYVCRIKKELDNEPTIVITGGNAPIITPFCSFNFVYEPSLLLEGIFLFNE